VLVRGWPDLEGGCARAREQDGRKIAAVARKRWKWKRQRREEEERGMGSNLLWATLFIGESTESARYGSFLHTMRLNGSIPISTRDNLGGFVADWLQP
jgi:hypothetical protein